MSGHEAFENGAPLEGDALGVPSGMKPKTPDERWAERVCPRDQDGNIIREPRAMTDLAVRPNGKGGFIVGG